MAEAAGLLAEFKEVCHRSRVWANKSNKMYKHSGMLCLETLRVCLSEKRVRMVQLDYGNGKSFLLLLIADYLTKVAGKDVVVVTLNNSLLN